MLCGIITRRASQHQQQPNTFPHLISPFRNSTDMIFACRHTAAKSFFSISGRPGAILAARKFPIS
jgi:hypothetical protein